MGFIRLIDNLYTVDSLVFVGNIDFENILVPRIVFCFDCKIILTGFSIIQGKASRSRCLKCLYTAVAGLSASDRSNLNALRIGADNGQFVLQATLGQLVVIYCIRSSGLLVLAKNLSLATIIEGIAHSQRDIIPNVQNDFKVSRMTVCKGGNRNSIRIGGLTRWHFYI